MSETFFVAGIYGVGKSTLCEKISKRLQIPFYSSGDLISQTNGEVYGANKVVRDKCNNQNILSVAVGQILTQFPQIILAGHFCIFDKNTNVDVLPDDVFSKLSIKKVVLLEADSSKIARHLWTRDNKSYTIDQINALKKAERIQAEIIAKKLSIPLIIHDMKFNDFDTEEIIKQIRGR